MSRILAFTFVFFILSGCASKPQIPENFDNNLNQTRLLQFDNWQLKGRLAFKSPEDKFSANIRWQQRQQAFDVTMTHLFGKRLMDMKSTPGYAWLWLDDQEFEDTDASFLIWRITGWNIPMSRLPLWVKGQFSPIDQPSFDDNGLVTKVAPQCSGCDNWLIHFSRYARVGEVWLPGEVTLENLQQPDNSIKIRITDWSTL